MLTNMSSLRLRSSLTRKLRVAGTRVTNTLNGFTPAAVKAQNEITPLLENANKDIILDCTPLEYISSSGLRLFLTIRKEAAAKGGKVIIANINEEIRKVFTMTGFFNLFEIR